MTHSTTLRTWIEALCGMMSVSGFETRSDGALRELLVPHFDEFEVDAVGNHLLYRRCGKKDAPTVLVDAHFDEIGFLVTSVLDGGFLRIAPLGGVDPSIMQAADVIVYGRETMRGVVVSTPPHLRPRDEKGKLPAVDEMMVDVGYDLPREELEALVPVGTPIGFAPYYTALACGKDGEKCLSGKSFDNKACGAAAAFAIATTPRDELAADVCLLLSSYEETSRLGGVSPAVYRVRPDYAMVVDVNLARVPDTKDFETVPFRGGVSISASAATDRRLTRLTRALCEEQGIPFSMIAAPSSTGTNAASVNLVGAGVPVVDVGLPLKNMHTYEEILCEQDVQALCDLVRAFVTSATLAEAFGGEKEVRI